MLQVQQVMYPVNIPLRGEMPLVEAIGHILDSGYLGLPVVDAQLNVIGFLSEFDCLPYLISDTYHCESHEIVSDIMRKDPLVVSLGTSIIDLAQKMGLEKPKVYAVVEGKRLAGIVTRSMLMRELNDSLKHCKVVA